MTGWRCLAARELVAHGGHQVSNGDSPGISNGAAGIGLLLQEHGQQVEQPLEEEQVRCRSEVELNTWYWDGVIKISTNC